MLLVLIAFICTIIFSWGGGGFSNRPSDTIGVIDDENIPVKLYSRYYSNLYRQEQAKTENELPPDKEQEIRSQAWSQLVADVLIGREIEKRHITVSDQELYEYLKLYPPQVVQQAPQFMTDGKFDHQKYMNAMLSPENAPFWAQLEALVLPELKRSKLQAEILSTVRITPAEVLEAYLQENEKIKIGYINVTAIPFEQIAPDPTTEEALAYYEANKEDYKQAERATLDVVAFEKTPSENDWQRVYAQASDIYDSITAGADFAEMAEIYSEDASASSGGDLGWFERGRMVPEFDSVTWTLSENEISKPVRTRYGWHIIKLLGIRQEKSVEQRNAAHILLKVQASQETIENAYNNARDFAEEAKELGLKAAADTFNFSVRTTPPFYKKSYMAFLGVNKELNEFAFKKEIGSVSDVVEGQNAYFVTAVASHLPESYEPFEKVENSIKGMLKKENAQEMALDTVRVMYDYIMAGNSFRSTAKKFGFGYQQSDMITRKDHLPAVGRSDEVIGAAFSLKTINGITPPVDYGRGAVIITLLEKESANLENFNQVQDSVQFALQIKKSQDVYGRWYQNLVSAANIENHVDDFYSNY